MTPRRGEVWMFDCGMTEKACPVLILSVPFGDSDRAVVTVVFHSTVLRDSEFEVLVDVPFLKPGTRVAAMKAGNREKLDGIFSDQLHYAHSTGEIDTKSSFIAKLTSGKTKYVSVDYEKRDFTFPAPGMALMTGRVHIRAVSGETTNDNVLSFLAAWRLENGQWRFLAWQSCRLPPKP